MNFGILTSHSKSANFLVRVSLRYRMPGRGLIKSSVEGAGPPDRRWVMSTVKRETGGLPWTSIGVGCCRENPLGFTPNR